MLQVSLPILRSASLVLTLMGASPVMGSADGGKGGDKKDKTHATANEEGKPEQVQAGADCRIQGSPVALPELPEASGLTASRRTPGLLWSHVDSGAPVLVALDSRGSVRGKVHVRGVTVTDWEDVAVGACGTSNCVYLADIGDNRDARKSVTVYRVPEPLPTDSATGSAETFRGVFPDGPHDAEALFVSGAGEMFVVTKGSTGPVALYRFPATAKPGPDASTLQRIGVIRSGSVTKRDWITGASVSLDGRWVALRTHAEVTFYKAAKLTKGDFGSPLKFGLAALNEPQGEGVALGAGGSVFFVGEGGRKGAPGTFRALTCSLSDADTGR